jgi:hypothetical protein
MTVEDEVIFGKYERLLQTVFLDAFGQSDDFRIFGRNRPVKLVVGRRGPKGIDSALEK